MQSTAADDNTFVDDKDNDPHENIADKKRRNHSIKMYKIAPSIVSTKKWMKKYGR